MKNLARKVLSLDAVGRLLKSRRLQPLWENLHRLSLYGMNYGGGYLLETSGERWVLERLAASSSAGEPLTVFDVGAHVGSYADLAREVLGDRARIYCFEPSPITFADLRNRVGEQPGIVLNNFGLGDREGEATLSSSGHGSPASSMYTPSEALFGPPVVTEKCLIRSLDRFCDEEQIRRIDLLKIDVEGSELNVLRGAARALEAGTVRLIQFEFGEAQVGSRTFFKDIYDTLKPGYRVYRILRAGLAPIDSYDEGREVFRTTNYLAVSRSLPDDGRRSWL